MIALGKPDHKHDSDEPFFYINCGDKYYGIKLLRSGNIRNVVD